MKTSLEPEIKAIQSEQIKHLEQQVDKIHTAMKHGIEDGTVLKQHVKALTTIKGTSDKTAIELVAYIKDINRFDKTKQLASYIRLSPQNKPAVNGVAYNPILKAFADRLRARGVTGEKMIACGYA